MMWLVALVVILLVPVIVIFMLIGVYVIYAGSRFKKSAGVDDSAFYTHWLVFIWAWAEQSEYIVDAMPFFKQDLTETFGIRPDDGRVT